MSFFEKSQEFKMYIVVLDDMRLVSANSSFSSTSLAVSRFTSSSSTQRLNPCPLKFLFGSNGSELCKGLLRTSNWKFVVWWNNTPKALGPRFD